MDKLKLQDIKLPLRENNDGCYIAVDANNKTFTHQKLLDLVNHSITILHLLVQDTQKLSQDYTGIEQVEPLEAFHVLTASLKGSRSANQDLHKAIAKLAEEKLGWTVAQTQAYLLGLNFDPAEPVWNPSTKIVLTKKEFGTKTLSSEYKWLYNGIENLQTIAELHGEPYVYLSKITEGAQFVGKTQVQVHCGLGWLWRNGYIVWSN